MLPLRCDFVSLCSRPLCTQNTVGQVAEDFFALGLRRLHFSSRELCGLVRGSALAGLVATLACPPKLSFRVDVHSRLYLNRTNFAEFRVDVVRGMEGWCSTFDAFGWSSGTEAPQSCSSPAQASNLTIRRINPPFTQRQTNNHKNALGGMFFRANQRLLLYCLILTCPR